MEEEESGSQGNVETEEEAEGVGEVKRRRRRGKASKNVTFRKKYSWKASSSTSEALDTDTEPIHCDHPVHEIHICPETDGFSESSITLDSEASDTVNEEPIHCDHPVHEIHICPETDGFSESSITLDSEASDTVNEAHNVVRKRRKPRKRFLSQRKTHGTKRVGDLKIDTRDELNSSSSDEDSVDLTGLDAASLDQILKACSTKDDLQDSQNSNEEQPSQNPAISQEQTAPTSKPEDTAFCETDQPVLAKLMVLQNNMKLLLSDCWSVQIIEGHILRILKISPDKNAFVDASIFFDAVAKIVGIFVHGVPVSPENRVFKCANVPDSENIGSLSDYLTELTTRVGLMKVCDGIREHEDYWNMSRGYLDYSTPSSPHYRSGSCELLIKQTTEKCQSCKEEIRMIERRVKRQETSKDSSDSTADKFLSKEKLKVKKDNYKKLYEAEKIKTRRLEKRLNEMKIKLDAALSDELSSILTANQHKMTPLQKLFWEQQLKAFSLNDARGMRWHPMLIRLALHLHSLSDNAYTFWGDTKLLMLPSKRRLYDYSHFIEPKEGCQPEFLQFITEKMKTCGPEDHYSYVNLMFDEMHIRSGLVVKRSTGELVGFTQLDFCEEELKQMQADIDSKKYKPQLAKKVLVYLVNGITSNNVKDVVAIYSTDILSASQLYDRTWEVIYNLEGAGIKVLAITCDGASVNRKFFFMHQPFNKEEQKFVYCTKNLAAGSRPLFFILDPPHLLKTIRNALANSFAHKNTRKMWKNNEYLSWKVIEHLYKITEGEKFRTHKLTKAHVKLTSFSCMTVLYATQVFSNSVAQSIQDLASQNKMEPFQTSELVKFIRLMNRFFDCMNGKEEIQRTRGENENEETEASVLHEGQEKVNEEGPAAEENQQSNPDKAAYTSLDDSRFDFLQNEFLNFFNEWKEDTKTRPGNFSETQRSRMTISHQGLGALEITVNGIVGAIRFMLSAGAPSVSARIFNQDPLEQYFGKVRRAQGDSNNPSLKSVHDIRLNMHAQGLVGSASQKGNTKAEKRKLTEIDSTPLPSKVQKK